MHFSVIDLFAGPGGLGEGFASLAGGSAFKIAVSAEMENSAHQTLQLRAFYRHIRSDAKALSAYYDFCNRDDAPHPKDLYPKAWRIAENEAQRLTLGVDADNKHLDSLLGERRLDPDRTVIIGGPPCQAYSLVGRARNKGKTDYVPENDSRHFLYREYLRTVHKYQPVAFVMENVKGILSARVGGRRVFDDILRDLSDPAVALGKRSGARYRIHSLVLPTYFDRNVDPEDINASDFIIEAERYGIPQARHRVILFGVRSDVPHDKVQTLSLMDSVSIDSALGDLPSLRSRLSKEDSLEAWREEVKKRAASLIKEAGRFEDLRGLKQEMEYHVSRVLAHSSTGGFRFRSSKKRVGSSPFHDWVRDGNLDVWLQHESRSHMPSDLARYFYAAAFGKVFYRTPKGHEEFVLPGLAPDHANWESGKFIDRFRVQLEGRPSSTVTSHIAKDGHYFIHYDPSQFRSLTVREAARLQTFPDNYFFMGNRTQQYHQVGNAVPSLLATQIANVVYRTIK